MGRLLTVRANAGDPLGFEFDSAPHVAETPGPDAQTLALIRGETKREIAELYPRFAARMGA